MEQARGRGRGRPPAAEALDHERIYETALHIAGDEGFPALTMRRLADELGVTVRALYHHVSGRQQVVDGVARLLSSAIPLPRLDASRWRESLSELLADLRAFYRGHPRAALLALDETVTFAGVDERRLRLGESVLELFHGLGLDAREAVLVDAQLSSQVLGFVLAIDYRYDRADETERGELLRPVPGAWLDAVPPGEYPRLRSAARIDPPNADEAFAVLVESVLAAVEHRSAAARAAGPSPRRAGGPTP